MNIYHYHPDTFEYLGASEARIDPLETVKAGETTYLIPANATGEEPPQAGSNQIARRIDDAWELVDDYRDHEYWDPMTGAKITIAEIGVTIPDGYPTQAPPTGMFNPRWDETVWVESALVFQGIKVETKADVDRITRQRIADLGEEKAKTEKLIAGDGECAVWDEFVAQRAIVLQEGEDCIEANGF